MKEFERRTFLTITATAGVGGLAGCMSDITGEDEETTDEDGAEETTDGEETTTGDDGEHGGDGEDEGEQMTGTAADYEDWIPAPDSATRNRFVYYADVSATMSADVDQAATERLDRFFFDVPSDALALDEVDRFLNAFTNACVCEYSVSREELVGRLEEFDPSTEQHDVEVPASFEAYETASGAFWVNDERVLWGQNAMAVKRMHDAKMGELERYVADDSFAEVWDLVKSGSIVAVAVNEEASGDGSMGVGYSWSFSSDSAEFLGVVPFEDESSTDESIVDEVTQQSGYSEYGEYDVQTDGRLVKFSSSIDLAEFDLLAQDEDDGGDETNPPRASFSFEFDTGENQEWDGEDGEKVEITHDGGDSIDLLQISVYYDGVPVSDNPDLESTPPEADEWTAGARWTVRPTTADAFESGGTMYVIWEDPDGGDSSLIAQAALP